MVWLDCWPLCRCFGWFSGDWGVNWWICLIIRPFGRCGGGLDVSRGSGASVGVNACSYGDFGLCVGIFSGSRGSVALVNGCA